MDQTDELERLRELCRLACEWTGVAWPVECCGIDLEGMPSEFAKRQSETEPEPYRQDWISAHRVISDIEAAAARCSQYGHTAVGHTVLGNRQIALHCARTAANIEQGYPGRGGWYRFMEAVEAFWGKDEGARDEQEDQDVGADG